MTLNEQLNSCEEFEPMISAMADGELDETELTAAQFHVADCDACRELCQNFATINATIASFSEPPQQSANQISVRQTFIVTRQRNSLRNWFSVWRLAPLAGVAALLVTLLVITVQPLPTATAEQLSADQFVQPLSDLNRINDQQQRDQELMLRTLQLDLRSLKLELDQLEHAGNEERNMMKQQIEKMLQRVQQFSVDSNQ